MTDSAHLTGGELNAAISKEVVRIHTANVGRGPNKTSTFHNGNVVVTVLQEVLTRAEQNLTANGDGETVVAMRRRLQPIMAEELKEKVEELTGRRVVAFMSDNHLDPDMAIKAFVLDGPIG